MTICRICKNDINNEVLISKEMFLGSRDPFEYIICSQCGSLSISEIPKNINKYYENYYSLSSNISHTSFLQKLIKKLIVSSSYPILCNLLGNCLSKQTTLIEENDLRIKALSPYKIPKTTKILDVGCGSGDFLFELKALGFQDLCGIDPYLDENKVSSTSALRLLKKSILEITDFFSLITFHHSFEHTENPQEILYHLKSILLPAGIVILRFPNIESYSFKRFRENWEGIHAPFHYFLPSAKGMLEMTERAGLKIIERRGEQMLSLFFNSIAHSLGVCDYENLGCRKYQEKFSLNQVIPPLLTHKEVSIWKDRKKQVLKYDVTDWIVYYLTSN